MRQLSLNELFELVFFELVSLKPVGAPVFLFLQLFDYIIELSGTDHQKQHLRQYHCAGFPRVALQFHPCSESM